MATLLKFTPEDLRQARKGGFKRKAPKKPKSKTFNSIEGFINRYNEYVKAMKAAAANGRKLDQMKKELQKV